MRNIGCRSVRVLRAEDGRIVRTEDFEEILSTDTFASTAMKALRALHHPGKPPSVSLYFHDTRSITDTAHFPAHSIAVC